MSDPLVGAAVDPDGPTPQVAPEPAPKQPTISPEEYDRLREELRHERENIRELRKGYQQEHTRRAEIEAQLSTIASIRQQEQEAARQAASLQEPPIDWSKFDDPELFRETLDKHGRYVEARLLHALKPYADTVRRAQGNEQLVSATSQALALRQAKEDWLAKGYLEDTWDEIEPDLRSYLKGNEAGIRAALSPGGGTTQALHFASQRNLPIQSAGRDEPPITTTGDPGSGDPGIDPEINPLIERVRRTLNLGSDWKPSNDELEEIEYQLGRQ